jgi:hypothetical protein
MRQYRANNANKIKKYQQQYDAAYYQINQEHILINKQKYYNENKTTILEDRKEHYQECKEEKQEYNHQYYQDNRDQLILDAKIYGINHPEWLRDYHNQYAKKRRASDPSFRIRASISSLINFYLKGNGSSKNGESCINYLPFSIQQLIQHLEYHFEPWMTWNNYGRYDTTTWDDHDFSTWKWQIDHIIPQSTLPYTNMEADNFKKCWSLDNLRPLSAKQNFLEGVNRTRHNSQ